MEGIRTDISRGKIVFAKPACRSIHWMLCVFAQMFAAPSDRAPMNAADVVKVVSAMSCGHLTPDILGCVGAGSAYEEFLAGGSENFAYAWERETKVSGFDEIIAEHEPDADLRLFAVSDLVGDMVVLWRQAAADIDCANGIPIPKAGHFGITWTHNPPFRSITDADAQNGVQSYIKAYFDGVPVRDIALDEGPWVVHDGWWFVDHDPRHLVGALR